MINPQYAMFVKKAAQKTGLPEELIDAQIKQESGYNPKAVSSAGAQGMLQLMPGTAKDLGVTDPFDPEQNIMAGASYLKQQLDNFGSLPKALAGYNAGPGNVKKYGGIPPFKETQDYVSKIMGSLGDDVRQKYPSFQWGGGEAPQQNRFALSDEPPKSNFALNNGGMEPQPDQGQQQASAIAEMMKAAGMDPESQKKQRRGDLVQDITSSIAAMAAGLRRDNGQAQQGILQGMANRQAAREERKQGAIAKLMDAYKASVPQLTDDQKEFNFAKGQGFHGSFVDYMKNVKGVGQQGPSSWEQFKWNTSQQQRQDDMKRQDTKDEAASKKSLAEAEQSFRKEFEGNEAVKNFRSVDDTVKSMRKSLNSSTDAEAAFDDIALLYAFAKANDPNTGVKEGELNLGREANSLLGKMGVKVDDVLAGRKLSDEQRKAIVSVSEKKLEIYKQKYKAYRKSAEKMAKGYGYRPEFALPDFGEDLEGNPQSSAPQGGSAIKQIIDFVMTPQGGGQNAPTQAPQSPSVDELMAERERRRRMASAK